MDATLQYAKHVDVITPQSWILTYADAAANAAATTATTAKYGSNGPGWH